MPDKESKKVSRRSLLRGGAFAGALGIGVAVTGGTPALAAALPSRAPRTSPNPRTSDGIVIYLADPRSGEMDIFAGTTRTRHTNPSLAATIAAIAAQV